MTDSYTYPPDSGRSGTVDTAKEQAGQLADSAKASASEVAQSAKSAATDVAGEAKRQAKDLLHESRTELIDQAGAQQQRVAAGLRSLGDELGGMARSSEQPGVAADLVSQAASRADSVASWLDARDPGSLLSEVKDFARRSPGTFIGLAALAGVVAGRLAKNLAADAKDEATSSSSHKVPVTKSAPSAQYVAPSTSPVTPPPVIAGSEPVTPPPVIGGMPVQPIGDRLDESGRP
ncbi:MAG TPA: hypothetical protein VNJ54_07030 [Plantibacter sp.]|uniref:hypothetical protein n=1 Tax=unclassified Plantibacter TaxID=2624265 RepID=UPI002CAAE405|nr:hypothetical protein [Plantibacter sp.]